MPSYGNLNIFGRSVSSVPAEHPRGEQRNAFPGLYGVESLDHGYRGTHITFRGVLVGNTVADLVAAESLFGSFKDGVGRILVEPTGRSWPVTKLIGFEPQGRIMADPYHGYVRPYIAHFESLK